MNWEHRSFYWRITSKPEGPYFVFYIMAPKNKLNYAIYTRLKQPLHDSGNLYLTHTTPTRLMQPLPDSFNLYKTHATPTRLKQPLPD